MKEEFPVHYNNHKWRKSIPLQLVSIHREQFLKNHYQTLEQLASRGGLDCIELYAVMKDMSIWQALKTISEDDAMKYIDLCISNYE